VSEEQAGEGNLEGTKEWRLDWWREILGYTLGGKYFWTGKGFGINLADDDGFQGTAWGGLLRSPHHGHMAVRARAGGAGLVLWLLVHLTWAVAIFTAHLRAAWAGDQRWAGLFLFVLAYWLALMTNAAFDVFIEGPMGGVWLWTVYGVGMAALWIYRYYPETLHEQTQRGTL